MKLAKQVQSQNESFRATHTQRNRELQKTEACNEIEIAEKKKRKKKKKMREKRVVFYNSVW